MIYFSPHRKQKKLTDFVDIYCDHRERCSNKRCPYGSVRRLKSSERKDPAFVENRYCDKFRGKDELGAVKGADIKEIGIWKPGA
jgi:hypothetical protein